MTASKSFVLLLLFTWLLAACVAPPPANIAGAATAMPTVSLAPTAVATSTATATKAATATSRPTAVPPPAEYTVSAIPLAAPLADDSAEISGLAWYGDTLILLPQYPTFAGNGGFLYALPKSAIQDYLDGRTTDPLTPQAIPFTATGLATQINGFEGYEAIAFRGDDVYLTVEANGRNGMMGYLVHGTIASDLSQITIDTTTLAEIPPQSGSPNKSDESLLVDGDRLVTLYEVNGAALNDEPVAHLFAPDLAAMGTVPLAGMEYRVTDATAVDEDGRFWVINYFFPGDLDLRPQRDPLSEQFGRGATHQQHEQVERLVELELTAGGIRLSGTPPIQLQLSGDDARNWEGIVRLDNRGFLLATDKFPTTILGFVATGEN